MTLARFGAPAGEIPAIHDTLLVFDPLTSAVDSLGRARETMVQA